MEIPEAFDPTGLLRGAAGLAGYDHKTVAHWVCAREPAPTTDGLPGLFRCQATWIVSSYASGDAGRGLENRRAAALVSGRAVRQILEVIAAGTFAVRSRLPTKQKLARQLGVPVPAALIEVCRNVFPGREGKRLLEMVSGPHCEDARRHACSDRELHELWARQHAHLWAAVAAGRAGHAERAGRAHLASVTTIVLGCEDLSPRERSRLDAIVERFDDDDDIASLRHRMSRREGVTSVGEL